MAKVSSQFTHFLSSWSLKNLIIAGWHVLCGKESKMSLKINVHSSHTNLSQELLTTDNKAKAHSSLGTIINTNTYLSCGSPGAKFQNTMTIIFLSNLKIISSLELQAHFFRPLSPESCRKGKGNPFLTYAKHFTLIFITSSSNKWQFALKCRLKTNGWYYSASWWLNPQVCTHSKIYRAAYSSNGHPKNDIFTE